MTARDTSMTTRSTRRVVPLALACAWLACALPSGSANAQAAATPAQAPNAAAGSATSAATQYTVKPGQSLADIATAITQSHDKTVLGRAARAIFDANPSAFMRNDPSLLKLGAVLNIPALDATGAVANAAPASSAVSAGATGPASAAAGTQPGGAPATKPGSAPAANVSPASASSAGASFPARATAPAAGVASNAAPAAAPATAPHPVPDGAAGGHAWSGAIEPASAPASATAPASAAAASGGAATSAASAAASAAAPSAMTGPVASAPSAAASGTQQPAVAALAGASPGVGASHPKVSSLQQLLTLKNRVLMELQRHGFHAPTAGHPGTSASAPTGASGFAQVPAPGGVVAPAPGNSRAAAAANQRFMAAGGSGFARHAVPAAAAIVAAIVAALLVVLVALGVSRRRRRALPGAGVTAGARPATPVPGGEAARDTGLPVAGPDDPIAAEFLSILERNPSSKRALMGLAAHYAERKDARAFGEIAQRIYRLSGGRGPNWTHIASLGRQLDPDNPLFAAESGETGETAPFAADEAAAPAEFVSDTSAAPPPEAHASTDEGASRVAEPAFEAPAAVKPPPSAETEREPEPEPDTARAAGRFEAEAPSAEQAQPSGQETREPLTAPESEPEPEPRAVLDGEPTLPPEAIAALGGLEIGLPPRVAPAIESPAHPIEGQAAEPTQPRPEEAEKPEEAKPTEPATGAVTAAHAEPLRAEMQPEHAERDEDADRQAPADRPTPDARPAVTGLGAAPVGRLKLSFDLNLPGEHSGAHEGHGEQSDIAPVPQFTPEQLARIARNKLDLAAEYISLGDLGGARTLIHEVIESNDAATHEEAHAMLAALAPHS